MATSTTPIEAPEAPSSSSSSTSTSSKPIDIREVSDLDQLFKTISSTELPDVIKDFMFNEIEKERKRRAHEEEERRLHDAFSSGVRNLIKQLSIKGAHINIDVDTDGGIKEFRFSLRGGIKQDEDKQMRPILWASYKGKSYTARSMRSLAFALDPKLRRSINARDWLINNKVEVFILDEETGSHNEPFDL